MEDEEGMMDQLIAQLDIVLDDLVAHERATMAAVVAEARTRIAALEQQLAAARQERDAALWWVDRLAALDATGKEAERGH
jgi:hypothetical protein